MEFYEWCLFGFLTTLGVLFVCEKRILKWYQTARTAYKLFYSIPPDDGTSEYTIVPGTLFGRIPYRYQGENRMFYVLGAKSESVSANIARLFGIAANGTRVNITPPPGYSLCVAPAELGFVSAIIQIGDDVSQYQENEVFNFPPIEDVVLYD